MREMEVQEVAKISSLGGWVMVVFSEWKPRRRMQFGEK
jgi:hypothetical protein